ncbi:MAG: hypothetical protein HC923_12085 [Myxococcales bacterium]|nr:hypothetical protein [Myxococcales bacterium]
MSSPQHNERAAQEARLVRTIETEIIPRLMLAHGGGAAGPSWTEDVAAPPTPTTRPSSRACW